MKPNELSPGPDASAVDRREFLRVGGALAAAGALATTACRNPQEATIPFNDMSEKMVDGQGLPRFFASVLDGSPVLVRTREGRPILVTPSPADPGGRGLALRHHAALMDLYDPDRAQGPVWVRRGQGAPVASSWTAVGAEVAPRLGKGGTVLLTGPLASPSLEAAIAEISGRTGLSHVVYAPLESDAVATVWRTAFGDARVPRPRLDRADLLVGFGAEFLDDPAAGFEGDFAAGRAPEPPGGAAMSRFVQVEGRLTLTGANADQRIRVRDSQLAAVAAAVAHEIVIGRRIGPLAGDAEVAKILAPFTPEAVAKRAGLDPAILTGLAAELAKARGRALVLAGGSASTAAGGEALELAVLLLNLSLHAFAAGLFDEEAAEAPRAGGARALAALVEEMRSGKVQTLIVAGANPVYDAPASLRFAEALAKVPFVVSLNDRVDETSARADYLAPASHPFESWGDAALPRGLVAIQQPVIQPLYDTRGLLDVLVAWGAAAGVPGTAAAAAAATQPSTAAAPGKPAPNPNPGWHFLRAQWGRLLGKEPGTPGFEAAWNAVLREGRFQGPRPAPAPPRRIAPQALALLGPVPEAPAAVELQLYPHLAHRDGRSANNGWLHELPDPVTRITWGGAVSIAPRRFDEMKLSGGDLVEVKAGEATLVAPAYRHAGMHNDQIAIPLGLGRSACGVIGSGIGPNGFPLRALAGGRVVAAGIPVTIRRVAGREALAFAQGSDVIDRERRPLVPATTLTAFEKDAASGTEQEKGGPSAWPLHPYPEARWAMAIDLAKCNGCGKCVIGCQAENNVPVVGRQGILDGREMSWIRIDRYYDAPKKEGGWGAEVWNGPLAVVEEPRTLFTPMLCQHCENAPCETVCPFVATTHSTDGLNQQAYNRCVGTRYCANNCPFKVRRFNFFEYSTAKESGLFGALVKRMRRFGDLNTRGLTQMKNNPEVTVRSRGVMEKCSFCIQRIRAARAAATRAGGKKDHFPDGAVVPACMEACPTGAITFGDVNAPGSRVAALAGHPRAMKLLEATGVKPSISYLTRVRNDKA
jgi:Fe-S-cluster-containing dehydrogenase component/anaerobic selenocysteine-containing dehydrogenase